MTKKSLAAYVWAAELEKTKPGSTFLNHQEIDMLIRDTPSAEPLPPIYARADALKRQLDERASALKASAWQLETALREVRLASDEERERAVEKLTAAFAAREPAGELLVECRVILPVGTERVFVATVEDAFGGFTRTPAIGAWRGVRESVNIFDIAVLPDRVPELRDYARTAATRAGEAALYFRGPEGVEIIPLRLP